MKIVFIGAKGIPAVSGGVEAHVDELSRGLVRAGHEAVVYVRDWYTPRRLLSWQGVRLIHLPTIRTKHLDATIHCLLASIHVLFIKADVIHYHAVGPAAFAVLPRLFGRRVVVTIHRRDWAADKWKAPARLLLKAAEWAAVRTPRAVIAVAATIRDGLAKGGRTSPVVIPNGFVAPLPLPPGPASARFGLAARRYVLFLGRLVPEKRPDWLIRAFLERRSKGDGLKLVLAGASSGTDDYVRGLKALAGSDPRIVFTGEIRGQDKDEIASNALLFVLPSRLEGYPIALLEALGAGLGCLASDIPPHREIVRDGVDGLLFRSDDFADFKARLDGLLSDPARIAALGREARDAAAARPDWDAVVRRTIEVYRAVRL
ncbi:MAG: glycosyltransferase family 4 protein [Acidobacteriota bacterium]|nr:glycosyltransferase family 4 protein [Acidobacteriota bacterium]